MVRKETTSWTQARWITLLLLSISSIHLSAQERITIDSVLKQNPDVSEGYALMEIGNPDGALEHFRTALSEDRKDLSALLGQALALSDTQRHAEAFETYNIIVGQYPQHAFAWNRRGLAAYNMEDFDEALYSFQQAIAEQPIDGFFYESLAWTQMCRGEFTEAAASAKQATLMYNRKSEGAAYPLLIAYFAHLEAGDQRNAQIALRYASQNKPINRWPAPVIDYLTDSIDANELISYVVNTAQETEAHTYIGLKLRQLEQLEKAQQHLDWVAHHGDPRVFEYTLARALNLRYNVARLDH
jgi:tetratricopeptide (TPR) repeat protein